MRWCSGHRFHSGETDFLKRLVTCKERLLVGSAVAKGWRTLGPPREMTKGTLGKDRTTWAPKVKQTTKCLDVPVTLAIYHADILPLWLIFFFFFQLPLLPLHAEYNWTLGLGSTSFLSRGHLDRAEQFIAWEYQKMANVSGPLYTVPLWTWVHIDQH